MKRAEPRRYGRQGPSKLQSPGVLVCLVSFSYLVDLLKYECVGHGRGGVGLYGEMQNHYYPQYPHNYGKYCAL